jgi:hypothetical protein
VSGSGWEALARVQGARDAHQPNEDTCRNLDDRHRSRTPSTSSASTSVAPLGCSRRCRRELFAPMSDLRLRKQNGVGTEADRALPARKMTRVPWLAALVARVCTEPFLHTRRFQFRYLSPTCSFPNRRVTSVTDPIGFRTHDCLADAARQRAVVTRPRREDIGDRSVSTLLSSRRGRLASVDGTNLPRPKELS